MNENHIKSGALFLFSPWDKIKKCPLLAGVEEMVLSWDAAGSSGASKGTGTRCWLAGESLLRFALSWSVSNQTTLPPVPSLWRCCFPLSWGSHWFHLLIQSYLLNMPVLSPNRLLGTLWIFLLENSMLLPRLQKSPRSLIALSLRFPPH